MSKPFHTEPRSASHIKTKKLIQSYLDDQDLTCTRFTEGPNRDAWSLSGSLAENQRTDLNKLGAKVAVTEEGVFVYLDVQKSLNIVGSCQLILIWLLLFTAVAALLGYIPV